MRPLTFNRRALPLVVWQTLQSDFNRQRRAQFSIFPAVASRRISRLISRPRRSPCLPSHIFSFRHILLRVFRRKQLTDVDYCIPLVSSASGCTWGAPRRVTRWTFSPFRTFHPAETTVKTLSSFCFSAFSSDTISVRFDKNFNSRPRYKR